MIVTMTRTQIQLPDPLYRRLKEVAASNDWSLAEVIRRAAELYVERFPVCPRQAGWTFPTVDMGGNFLADPAEVRAEADALVDRNRK